MPELVIRLYAGIPQLGWCHTCHRTSRATVNVYRFANHDGPRLLTTMVGCLGCQPDLVATTAAQIQADVNRCGGVT